MILNISVKRLDSTSAVFSNFIRMSIRLKNSFWALNSFESFSSGVIALPRTVYIEISLGFTPKIGFSSRILRAFALHLVHSSGVRIPAGF